MDGYINMQQVEYDEIQARLLSIHQEILSAEKEIRAQILSLVSYGGGFYVGSISAEVTAKLMNMVIIVGSLSESFSFAEREITSFVKAIIDIDVVNV